MFLLYLRKWDESDDTDKWYTGRDKDQQVADTRAIYDRLSSYAGADKQFQSRHILNFTE